MEFENIQNRLLQERDDIYKLQREYRLKLEALELKYKENKVKISENCVKHHGDHIWEAFHEEGPYGQRYFICKKCNAENY